MSSISLSSAPPYVPLWLKTGHSFLEGASRPEELVGRAHALGLPAMAVTDRDGVYGLVRAHVEARQVGMRVIPGAEVTLARGRRVVLLARGRRGYAAMCRLLSLGHARCEKGRSEVTLDELRGAAGELVLLCPEPAWLPSLREAFGDDLYALCARQLRAEERPHERRLRAAAKSAGVPCVGAVEVLYHDRSRRPLQDVMTCIRHGCTLPEAGARTRPNAEHDLKSPEAMAALFADAPELLRRTLEIAERCELELSQIHYRYPAETPDGRDASDRLRELTFEGARVRYGRAIPAEVRDQLERELALIRELDYGGYFLTMHELVRFCRSRDILCQGRGSAANSAVCFCLGITAIDPVRMDLLFERFLSRERAEPPDIDLDIEHERREEVIQHVYDKYGRRHAAMVANVIRYRPRSAVRDVGKALGIPGTDLDAVARRLGYRGDLLDPQVLRDAGLDPDARSCRHLIALANQILDFPRHLSIHPGGFLLGRDPVDSIVPIEPATMEGRTVIQWDKDDLEDLGLFKVDLLGLGALTAIHRSFDLLRAHECIDMEMASVPAGDGATYEMISAADTVGVFQIESRAQMAMLPRLKPRAFYDLVIEVAIVRPGPIQGDMVHPYLRRRTGQEPIEYPHPSLERVLHKTLGVPIFQEQVMKLAILAADYTPGEADQLRKDMAAWRKEGRIETHHARIVQRMVQRGIPEEFAERVFSQIRGFGEYGFPESHAASFALLAYITAWLRCNHPAVFSCAMLNSQPMGFYSPSTLVEDAKRHGIEVRPIDVNRSQWDCTLERMGPADKLCIRMGLRYVKGLGTREREAIDEANEAGPYASIEDFAGRTRLGRRPLVMLAEAGAFDALGAGRRDAIWKARAVATHAGDTLPLRPADSRVRFRSLTRPEEIAWDYRTSHHSARGHPMAQLRPALRARGLPDAAEVRAIPDGTRIDYVGIVICRQRPGTATGVTFFTLEDETGFANLVLWRPVFDRHASLAKTASLLGVRGKVQSAEGVVHIIVERLWAPALEDLDRADSNEGGPRSRDFR